MAAGWSKREGHRYVYNNILLPKKIFFMSCLTKELMWLLNEKTWVVFHVAAETEAGLVPTLLLQCVTGVKIPQVGERRWAKPWWL